MKGMIYMMNYRDFFENAFDEAFEKAPFSDDEAFVNIVKERTGNMEKKKFGFRKPAVIAASIAAAAALTVSVGALVNYFHRQSVDIFFPDASETVTTAVIDEESPLSSANEHFRITLDKTYFDGNYLTCIMTAESLDGTPLPRILPYACHDGLFHRGVYPLHYDMSTEFRGIDPRGSLSKPFVVHISEHELNTTMSGAGVKTLTGGTYIRFNIYDYPEPRTFSLNENGEYELDDNEDEWNELGGIELYTEVEKNIGTAEVFNENGDKLTLTQIGFYSDTFSLMPRYNSGDTVEMPEIKPVMNDGTTRPAYEHGSIYATWSDTWCYFLLPELIQLDDIGGIEINGERYLKKS